MPSPAERTVTDAAPKALVGRCVVSVRYMSGTEASDLGWSKRSAVLQFDDGTVAYLACDEEGNDAGALLVQTKHSELCLGRFPA